MRENEFQSVMDYGEQLGFTLNDKVNYFELTLERNSLIFKVTVASDVLEWYVDISEPETGLVFSDWADYVGYDRRPRNELVEEMTDHLQRLFKALMFGTFRLSKGKTRWHPSDHCEWLKGDKWVKFNYGET